MDLPAARPGSRRCDSGAPARAARIKHMLETCGVVADDAHGELTTSAQAGGEGRAQLSDIARHSLDRLVAQPVPRLSKVITVNCRCQCSMKAPARAAEFPVA